MLASRIRRGAIAALAVFILLIFTAACKARPSSEKKPVDEETKRKIEFVQPVHNRFAVTKNSHAAVLYQSVQQIQTLAGGQPTEDFTQWEGLRTRQFQNAVAERKSGMIVGGRKVAKTSDPTRFQFQVALVYTGYLSTKDGQFCSGSLLSANWVLTAAHCLKTLQPGDVSVFAGSYNLSQPNRPLIKLADGGIIRHEQYNNSETYPLNDVALLRLASPINDLKTVTLADDATEQAHSFTTNAIISGWGDTSEGSLAGSEDLLYTRVGIVDQATCSADYSGSITGDMLCATKANAGICQGDSGGPLIIVDAQNNWYQEGIVSWGIGCAESGYPGVYARVPKYAPWINAHVQ